MPHPLDHEVIVIGGFGRSEERWAHTGPRLDRDVERRMTLQLSMTIAAGVALMIDECLIASLFVLVIVVAKLQARRSSYPQ